MQKRKDPEEALGALLKRGRCGELKGLERARVGGSARERTDGRQVSIKLGNGLVCEMAISIGSRGEIRRTG